MISKNQVKTQASVDKQIARDEELMAAVCAAPVVTDDETARKFGEGIRKWMNLPKEDREKLQELDSDQIKKHFGDSDIAAAGEVFSRAASRVNKALTRTLYTEKALGDGLNDPAPLMVASGISTADDLQFDMGWARAFNVVSAANHDSIKVMDLHGAMRMMEFPTSSDKIPAQPLATRKSEQFGPRFFGGSFEWNFRDMRFSVYTVNMALTALRAAAVNNAGIHAYRILASMQSTSNTWDAAKLGVTAFATGSGTDTDKQKNKISRDRKMLNAAHFKIINDASNLQQTSGKRKATYDTAPISGLTPDTTVLAYVNHKWYERIELIQRMTGGDDGINIPLLKNIAFVQSIHLPECGAMTITEATERDDWGFLETTKPQDPANHFGCKMVIPGRRNILGIFRPNTLFSDIGRAADESMTITMKQEQNGTLESRQHAYVKLGDDKF